MATIDRFKDMLKKGRLPEEQGGQPLTAQTKYDFLAAVHTMDQLLAVDASLKKRTQKRAALREKLLATARAALEKLTASENALQSTKDIDAALKVLHACRSELLPLEGEERAERAVERLIADGITAK